MLIVHKNDVADASGEGRYHMHSLMIFNWNVLSTIQLGLATEAKVNCNMLTKETNTDN